MNITPHESVEFEVKTDMVIRRLQHPVAAWSLSPDMEIQFQCCHYPSRFHRALQKWLLGIYWRKI